MISKQSDKNNAFGFCIGIVKSFMDQFNVKRLELRKKSEFFKKYRTAMRDDEFLSNCILRYIVEPDHPFFRKAARFVYG